MEIHTRALLTEQTAAMISEQVHRGGLKSNSADGSSLSAHFPHILSLVIDAFSRAQVECAKWEGNYE